MKSRANSPGFGGVAGNLSNSGIVDLTTYMPGNILTVGGNYTGRNGLILLQTETGGDNSKTDRLVIKGNASTVPVSLLLRPVVLVQRHLMGLK